MPKGKRSNGRSTDFSFKGFISFPLTAETKNHFRAWNKEGMDAEVDFDSILASGYKFSCSFYAGNSNFSATFTCVNPDDPNFGYALSAFGPTGDVARSLLLYKHSVIASGSWRDAVGAIDSGDDIG